MSCLRQLDEVACRCGCRRRASRECSMTHTPSRLVEADLDEVVAGAERAEVLDGRCRGRASGCLATICVVARRERRPGLARCAAGGVAPRAAVVAAAVVGAAVRHGALDRRAQRARGRRAARSRVSDGAHRHHAAADVHAHRGRDDRALGRDHAADGRAVAEWPSGIDGDPPVDERQPRRRQLPRRRASDRDAAVHALMNAPSRRRRCTLVRRSCFSVVQPRLT